MKKKILVIADSELNSVLESFNRGMKEYELVGLPLVFGSSKQIVESQLSSGNYSGVLIDENYLDFVARIKEKGIKFGVIAWHDSYDKDMGKVLRENKILRFGTAKPSKIKYGLDKIFA